MDPGMIAAFAAVSGPFIGSLGSVLGGWINQSRQDHRAQLAKEIAAREELYSDFIAESARLLLDALEHNVTDRQSLIPVCAVLSRIRLSSSSRVLEKPETVLQSVLATYGKPTLTAEQITVSGREKSGPAKRVRRHLSQ